MSYFSILVYIGERATKTGTYELNVEIKGFRKRLHRNALSSKSHKYEPNCFVVSKLEMINKNTLENTSHIKLPGNESYNIKLKDIYFWGKMGKKNELEFYLCLNKTSTCSGIILLL